MALKIGKVLYRTFVLAMLCFGIYFCNESIQGWNESPVSISSKINVFTWLFMSSSIHYELFQLTKSPMIRLPFPQYQFATHYQLGLGLALLHSYKRLIQMLALQKRQSVGLILKVTWKVTLKSNGQNVKIC